MRKCMIGNDGYRCNNGHIKLPLQPFLNDLKVKHAQEAAAETKSKGHRTLGNKNQGSVIKLQFLHRRSKVFVFFGINWINTRKYHRLNIFKTCHSLSSRVFCIGYGISYLYLPGVLDPGDQISHIAGTNFLSWKLF